MAEVKVYSYSKCSTCRKALKWLDQHGVNYRLVDIVSEPPSAKELERVLRVSGLPVRKLFNTSGVAYREGGFSARLDEMTDREALDALAADGKLIKRPLVVAPDAVLVGFVESAYRARFRS